ncbi:MAG: enoyl-CoA hydratase/isomerase family protein [Frankiaceae bacterium]|nr:enoyl-CoA hydratase/isomerase family protein [Frankiaceae bacterium]MBV9869437.1 enoyl-CoA hydratase/isomerase family protein [Frankiaceae bacterium]
MLRTEPRIDEPDWMLTLTVEDGIGIVTLVHPEKLNAWSWEATRQLAKRAQEIRFNDEIRVVLIRGEGRAFCAGIDVGDPGDRVTGRSPAEHVRNFYEALRWVHEQFRTFANLPQPIVAAVHGYCLGFGFELAMMADIRIAADDAKFGLPEAGIGVSIDAGGDMRIARDAGAGWAKYLALTGRRIDAATAERIGLVQLVTTPEELDEAALQVAREIRDNAPLAVQSIKRTINEFADRGLTDAMRFEALSAAVEFVSEDMPKGYAAKAARETPKFEGK